MSEQARRRLSRRSRVPIEGRFALLMRRPLEGVGIGLRRPLYGAILETDRRIDWQAEPTSSVVAKLRAADSRPGVLDVIGGAEYFLFGGHADDRVSGQPGAIIAQRDGAICRATIDCAVWIPQLRRRPAPGGPATCKLPATLALRGLLADVPQLPAPLMPPPGRRTRSLAGTTRVSVTTTRSRSPSSSGSSRKIRCRTSFVRRSYTSSRAESRRASGRCAISSGGRS